MIRTGWCAKLPQTLWRDGSSLPASDTSVGSAVMTDRRREKRYEPARAAAKPRRLSTTSSSGVPVGENPAGTGLFELRHVARRDGSADDQPHVVARPAARSASAVFVVSATWAPDRGC